MKKFFVVLFCLASFSCGDTADSGENNEVKEKSRNEKIFALQGIAADGEALYQSKCSFCHAQDGSGIEGVGPEIRTSGVENSIEVTLNGKGTMSAYGDDLTDQEIANITAYTGTFVKK